jgi:hypothetical protein
MDGGYKKAPSGIFDTFLQDTAKAEEYIILGGSREEEVSSGIDNSNEGQEFANYITWASRSRNGNENK